MYHFKPGFVKHTCQPSTACPANSTDTIVEIIQYANTFCKMFWPLFALLTHSPSLEAPVFLLSGVIITEKWTALISYFPYSAGWNHLIKVSKIAALLKIRMLSLASVRVFPRTGPKVNYEWMRVGGKTLQESHLELLAVTDIKKNAFCLICISCQNQGGHISGGCSCTLFKH